MEDAGELASNQQAPAIHCAVTRRGLPMAVGLGEPGRRQGSALKRAKSTKGRRASPKYADFTAVDASVLLSVFSARIFAVRFTRQPELQNAAAKSMRPAGD